MDAEKKSIELTYDKAVELLDRAVAEKGEEYTYEPLVGGGDSLHSIECAYFHDERPGCIVGHVLSYAGLARDDLRDHDHSQILGRVVDLNTMAGPDTLAEYGVLKADPLTINLLAGAQQRQDEGLTWGFAVEAAKEGCAA